MPLGHSNILLKASKLTKYLELLSYSQGADCSVKQFPCWIHKKMVASKPASKLIFKTSQQLPYGVWRVIGICNSIQVWGYVQQDPFQSINRIPHSGYSNSVFSQSEFFHAEDPALSVLPHSRFLSPSLQCSLFQHALVSVLFTMAHATSGTHILRTIQSA